MELYSGNNDYKLYYGNMLDLLEVIDKETIDSIITDPPYELNFMSKNWDNSGIAFQPSTWAKCYEVLKPGGYLLAFGGSRTFHRIACAIEDAGFEIRDTIMWLYGAGFPKSMNIGKQLEKRLEDEKTKQETKYNLRLMWERDIQKTKRNEEKQDEVLQSQLQEQSLQRTMYGEKSKESNLWREEPCLEGWNNIQKTKGELQRCKVCEVPKRVFINGEERWICNGTQVSDGKTIREMLEKSGSCASYRPQPKQQQDRELDVIQEQWGTQESREIIEHWNSWGTALKPSFEPIIVARKPFKGSLVDNVIEYGVGGINIDDCRVGNETIYSLTKDLSATHGNNWGAGTPTPLTGEKVAHEGRFPANTILTYNDTDFNEVCGGFPNTKSGNLNIGHKRGNGRNDFEMFGGGTIQKNYGGDSGSASRYFYCAKASKKDRDEGLDEFEEKESKLLEGGKMEGTGFIGKRRNIHPTVKPTELMQYLVRLVSPDGATILDPFNGSGSTGKAVMYENRERNKNYKYIGIELTEEYLPISKARIEYVCNLPEEKDPQMTIFDFIGE